MLRDYFIWFYSISRLSLKDYNFPLVFLKEDDEDLTMKDPDPEVIGRIFTVW